MAESSDTTTSVSSPEPEAARMTQAIAARILADIERTGKQAQANRLTELLLELTEGSDTPH